MSPSIDSSRNDRRLRASIHPPGSWLVAFMVLVMGLSCAEAADEPDVKKDYAKEYHLLLKGKQPNPQDFKLMGPDADRCVHFEPDGLRITLPTGYPGGRPSTGVVTHIVVQGDFEITADYEFIQAPETAQAGTQTKLSLGIVLNRGNPNEEIATISRMVTAAKGPVFVSWTTLWNQNSQKNDAIAQVVPAHAKTGRLRLQRSGAVLSFYVSEGSDNVFQLQRQAQFGVEELKDVRIIGSTGGPKASLDVRVTDLLIRAGSKSELSEVVSAAPTKPKGWMAAGLILGLVLVASFALVVWFYVRKGQAADKTIEPDAGLDTEAQPASPAPTVSVQCSGCGKDLKARAGLAGKKVKCPQCGQGVQVPAIKADEPDHSSS